jgi:hypothetical protein
MWKSILYAKNIGCKEFDMWGSLAKEYDARDPWAGFTRFKQGYGTTFVEYIGSYDVVYKPLQYHLYNLVFAFSVEGQGSTEEQVENHSTAPQVARLIIVLLLKYLRCCIV